MKKLILALAVVCLFVSGSAFAATVNCVIYPGFYSNLAPLITSDSYFTIETDDSGIITSFTDLFSNYYYAGEDGGWDPRDGEPFTAGEEVFPNGVQQIVSQVQFDGNTAGTSMWWKQRCPPPINNLILDVGLFSITYNSSTTDGVICVGPREDLVDSYVFHAVPIPSAVWFLGSGLIGISGFRRKLRKEVA